MQLCLVVLKPYNIIHFHIMKELPSSMITSHSLQERMFTKLNQPKFATKAGGGQTRNKSPISVMRI